MNRCLCTSAAIFAITAALAVRGATWKLAANESSATTYSALTNAYSWVDLSTGKTRSGDSGEALRPTEDYLVRGGWTAVTPVFTAAGDDVVFLGKSMTLGLDTSEGRIRHRAHSASRTTWDNWGENEGLILWRGHYITYFGSDEADIYGKVRVTAPASEPFILAFSGTNEGMNWYGDFSGDAGTKFRIDGVNYSSSTRPRPRLAGAHCGLHGSLTNYFGDIGISNVVLTVGNTVLAGSLELDDSSRLATLEPDGVFTVGSLSFVDSGSGISVKTRVDSENPLAFTNSMIVVTNVLSVADTAIVTAGDSFYIAVTNTATRLPVLTVPSTVDICPAQFSMDRARMIVTTNAVDGRKTLEAVVTPTVIRNTATTVSTADAAWSDGVPVHANACYILQKVGGNASTLSTPAEQEYAFPGEILTVNTSCTFQPNTTCTNLYVKELRLNGSGICMFAGSAVLRGRVVMPKASIAYICPWNNATLNLAADVVGDEDCRIVMDGRHNNTSTRKGCTRLTGDNSRFFGTITVGLNRDPMTIADGKYQWLYVSDPAKLGAPRRTFSARALVLKRLARLAAEGSVTFSDTTRGIFIGYDGNNYGGPGASNAAGTDSEGQFSVGEGDTLTILTQLTMNGRLHKYGAGTLALGGPLKFGVDGGDEPLAYSNLLAVAQGYVKPLAADSFNGLEMTFAAGTGIKLDIDPQDADLRAYGLRNTKAATPFAAANGGQIPVGFDVPAGFMIERSFSVGLVTVPVAQAEAVKNMLAISKPKIGPSRMSIDSVPEGDHVTIRATFKPAGLIVSLK